MGSGGLVGDQADTMVLLFSFYGSFYSFYVACLTVLSRKKDEKTASLFLPIQMGNTK